ncbi:MAG: hypothetical protein JOZ54_22755, partial [Acidobacteria bacterium]|nr:hypothetical protein [Acidobacteriota bacterium]
MTPEPRPAAPPSGSETTGIVRWQKWALIAGVIGIALSAAGWVLNADAFYKAWLPSYLFWFEIAAGSLGVLMLQYVTGGEWGLMIRRPLGAAARSLGVMVILFIPIVLGMSSIYPWTNHELMAHDPVLSQKVRFLNSTGWLIRTGVYFALWLLWAWRLRVLSTRFYQDRSPYTELSRRKWAASGLLMFVLTITFAAIDWGMSLEPKWFSSMYGITFIISCGLSAFAFVTFFLTRLAETPAMKGILRPSHLRDLGNLMFAFTMLWAYTGFSQYLLIWYANLKEEIPYYLTRQHGVWGAIAVMLILFHFFLPFFMLLMRAIKDRAQTIAVVTVIILVMRYVHIYWLVAPAHYGEEFHYSWISLT